MTKQQIIDFVNDKVKVSMGRISALDPWNPITDGDSKLVQINFKMLVVDRTKIGAAFEKGKEPSGDMIHVGTSVMLSTEMVNHMNYGSPEENLLALIQRQWTSLWMHESLETIWVVDNDEAYLPFDPHCEETSLKPMNGTFLTDVTACN